MVSIKFRCVSYTYSHTCLRGIAWAANVYVDARWSVSRAPQIRRDSKIKHGEHVFGIRSRFDFPRTCPIRILVPNGSLIWAPELWANRCVIAKRHLDLLTNNFNRMYTYCIRIYRYLNVFIQRAYQACVAPGNRRGHCRHVSGCVLEEFRSNFARFADYMCIIEQT